MLDTKSKSDLDSSLKNELNYLINIINDLKKIKEEGNVLYKNNKLEEAKNIFLKGYNLFQQELNKIEKIYSNEDKINELYILYKKILSKIAKCFYKQEKYKNSIIYDLKIIELEPKNSKSLVRLFYSYSKLNKCQQAIYYGEIILGFNDDIKNKYVDISKNINEEKIKLSKIKRSTYIKNLFIFFGSVLIIFISILLFYIFKNCNYMIY